MLGGSGTCSRKNFEMIDAIWCVLMHYFDQITSYKSPIIYYKNNYYSYTLDYTRAMGYFTPREIKKKHALVDACLSYLA